MSASRMVLARPLAVIACGLLLTGVVPCRLQAQTITRVAPGLSFGTALPGQGTITVQPWDQGIMGRRAPVFLISGSAGATVKVRLEQLPTTMENGSGGTVTVSGYVVQYNQVNSAAGATTLSATAGIDQAVTLDGTGKGYLSIGATISPGPAQPKGAYAFGEGGMVSVSP